MLIVVIAGLETFFEIKIKRIKIRDLISNENILARYTMLEGLKKDVAVLKLLALKLFQNSSKLYYISIVKNNSVIFYATRGREYDNILSMFSSSIINNMNKKVVKYNINKNIGIEIFNSSSGGIKIFTGFLVSDKFIDYILLRNSLISIVSIFLLLFIRGKNNIEGDQDYVPSEDSNPRVEPAVMNYKNLYEDNQKLVEELENLTTFREVGLAINSILDFNQMLHVIMGVIIAKMNVRKVVVYLIDETQKELRGKIGREANKIISENELEFDKIIIGLGEVGRAMEYHAPVIVSESNTLICPLIAKGDLIGATKIEAKIDGERFIDRDKKFMQLLSSQIAIALNNARLYEMAITDGLTKLYVHRHFQYKMQEEILRSKRSGKPISLIMLDIDHFKNFNDTYGHQAGDYILAELAGIVKKMFRSTDATFRYGGEEMAVILPETDGEDAYILSEKLRENIMQHRFDYNNQSLEVTVSLGVATYYPDRMANMNKERLIKMADDALYYSKEHGRNRTTLFSDNIKLKSESLTNNSL